MVSEYWKKYKKKTKYISSFLPIIMNELQNNTFLIRRMCNSEKKLLYRFSICDTVNASLYQTFSNLNLPESR